MKRQNYGGEQRAWRELVRRTEPLLSQRSVDFAERVLLLEVDVGSVGLRSTRTIDEVERAAPRRTLREQAGDRGRT